MGGCHAGQPNYAPLGQCLDEVDGDFSAHAIREGIAEAANISQIQPVLDDFATSDVLNFTELGASMANLSAAVNWPNLKPELQQVLSQLQDDSSAIMNAVGTLAQSINLTQAGDILKSTGGTTDGSDVLVLLYELAGTVHTATFATTIKNVTAALDLGGLGLELDGIKGNIDLQLLGEVVANLHSAVNFEQVGYLLKTISNMLSFQGAGAAISNLAVLYANGVSQACVQ